MKTIKTIRSDIRKQKTVIKSERDKLRRLIDQAECLDECCEEAIEALNIAADSLSELV